MTSPYFWLNAWSYAPLGCDFMRGVGRTMDAFALSKPVRGGYALAVAATKV